MSEATQEAAPAERKTRQGADEIFLTARQTRQRYGDCSDMWLWRRLHDDSGFPQPLTINGRRFFRLSDLLVWEARQSRGAVA